MATHCDTAVVFGRCHGAVVVTLVEECAYSQTIPPPSLAVCGRSASLRPRYPLARYTAIGSIAPPARALAVARIGATSAVKARSASPAP